MYICIYDHLLECYIIIIEIVHFHNHTHKSENIILYILFQGTNAVGKQTEPVVYSYPKEAADQSCQTIYDKYLLQTKVDNMILHNLKIKSQKQHCPLKTWRLMKEK